MKQLDYDYLATLVSHTLNGDSDAYAELYTATYDKQYSFICLFTKDPELAKDILADVYTLALHRLYTLKDPRLFVPWLNQLTFRFCYEYKVNQNEEKAVAETDAVLVNTGTGTGADGDSTEAVVNDGSVAGANDSSAAESDTTRANDGSAAEGVMAVANDGSAGVGNVGEREGSFGSGEGAMASDGAEGDSGEFLDKYDFNELSSKVLALKTQESRAIIMYSYNNMSVEEIADAMDLRKSVVRRRINSGMKKLRASLGEHSLGIYVLVNSGAGGSHHVAYHTRLCMEDATAILLIVLERCNMDPASIPIHVLREWNNYTRSGFPVAKGMTYVLLLLTIMMPVLFFKPEIVAEQIDVTDADSRGATYGITINGILPPRTVAAVLNGEPASVHQDSARKYRVKVFDNGELTITATSINGQISSKGYAVTSLDVDKPEYVASQVVGDAVYITVRDLHSGIDYDNISGLDIVSINKKDGIIGFALPDGQAIVKIPDKQGNVLELMISM